MRDIRFVSRKISNYFANLVKHGYEQPLELGNVNSKRDWGYAPDYVKAMYEIMQGVPDDYVVASGCSHTVKEFVNNIATFCNIELIWDGEGVSTKAYDSKNGNIIVKINSAFFRPIEPRQLKGDISKIKAKIGWKPHYTFEEMCKLIISEELGEIE